MPLYKVDEKYTGCNLKTEELLDCALIGVCAVIKENMVQQNHTGHQCLSSHGIDLHPNMHAEIHIQPC